MELYEESAFLEVMDKISETEGDVWQSEYDVVDERGSFRLLHYKSDAEERYETPMLMVYAFINRPYVLDLQPEVSVVKKYLEAGFDVYMIDWGYPTEVDKYLEVDDYIAYVDDCIEMIKERTGCERVTLHGYCLGGVLSYLYTSIREEKVKNLVLQAAPVDFDTDNVLAKWAREMPVEKVVENYGYAPGEFLKIGFVLADPIRLVVGRYQMLPDIMEDEAMLNNFLRMEKWVFDSPGIPGNLYINLIKDWYQENSIIKGDFEVLGENVDLSDITVPTLILTAEHDHIAPPESCKKGAELISSEDMEVIEMEKGHIGMTVSTDTHQESWPHVVDWLEKRSGEKKKLY